MSQNQNVRKMLLTFFIYIVLSIFLSYIHYVVLDIETLDINEFNKNLQSSQSNTLDLSKTNFSFSNIYIIAIREIVSTFIIAFLILLGFVLFNKKINFSAVLKAVISAKYIFLLSIIFEIIYLKYILVDYTLLDINYYSPLSLINFFDYTSIDIWFVYPLQTINLFEVFFVLLIAYFVSKNALINFKETLKVVSITYLITMFLWISIVMFLILNNS